jgi:plasmid stabilization system protein ParE
MGAGKGADEGLNRLRIEITDVAEQELLDAYSYYESLSEGLGAELRAEVDRSFEFILAQPRMDVVVEGEVRRALLRRFPYGIFYRLESNVVRVIAFFNLHQDPRRWRRRLQ